MRLPPKEMRFLVDFGATRRRLISLVEVPCLVVPFEFSFPVLDLYPGVVYPRSPFRRHGTGTGEYTPQRFPYLSTLLRKFGTTYRGFSFVLEALTGLRCCALLVFRYARPPFGPDP